MDSVSREHSLSAGDVRTFKTPPRDRDEQAAARDALRRLIEVLRQKRSVRGGAAGRAGEARPAPESDWRC